MLQHATVDEALVEEYNTEVKELVSDLAQLRGLMIDINERIAAESEEQNVIENQVIDAVNATEDGLYSIAEVKIVFLSYT